MPNSSRLQIWILKCIMSKGIYFEVNPIKANLRVWEEPAAIGIQIQMVLLFFLILNIKNITRFLHFMKKWYLHFLNKIETFSQQGSIKLTKSDRQLKHL